MFMMAERQLIDRGIWERKQLVGSPQQESISKLCWEGSSLNAHFIQTKQQHYHFGGS
jgi:hypothetical protein